MFLSSLLIALVGLQGSADSRDLQRLTDEVNRMNRLLQEELRPVCSSEIRLQGAAAGVVDPVTPLRVNLFSMVSAPVDTCLPADIRLTATYFDPAGAFVCSGTIEIRQPIQIQNTLLEIRPYEPEAFLKWWDGPALRQQLLSCRDYQGNDLRSPVDFATSVRIYASVFPKRGGLSTFELHLDLPRLQRR